MTQKSDSSAPCAQPTADSPFRRRLRRVCRSRPHLVLIFLVSILGFCYHFHLALQQYWQYSTTVSFAHEIPLNYQFEYPSLTLCFPDIIPHFRLRALYPDYARAVDQINNASFERKDPNFWTKEESKEVNEMQIKGKYLYKLFEAKVVDNTSVWDLLSDEWTFNAHDECLLDAKPVSPDGHRRETCESLSAPIQSLNGDFRCFTFLSQLDTHVTDAQLFRTSQFISQLNFEKRTNKVLYVAHALNASQPHHPFERDFRGRALIHPPNAIPVPNHYPSIPVYQWSRFYDLQFHKTVSHLLEAPYATNCRHYRTGANESEQSFDDCFTKCVIRHYRRDCQCLPRSGLLLRRSLVQSDDRFCAKVNKCQFRNFRLECETACQHDCLEQQYSVEKFADIPFYAHNNLSGIQVSRKPVLDAVYRHSPAVTFIQLICDFGGLGGLWLGFSVITITTAIIQLLTKPLQRIVNSDDDL